jgi:ribonuclease HI
MTHPNANVVVIYTDGACEPNPGPGGWGAVIQQGGQIRELSGAEADTTNNRMELRAAIEALRALPPNSRVALYTDSEYLQRGMTQWLPNWLKRKRKPANWDLWEELLRAAQAHTVRWHWVQGHAGHRLNERAHRLAAAQLPPGRFG